MIVIILIIACITIYSCQHNFIFFPSKLPRDHVFRFKILKNKFEERYFQVDRGTKLHGILFKSITDEGLPVTSHRNNRRKLVFYLHGNVGNLALWGNIAPIYTYHGYDIFILDYRGFGKSEGYISYEKQLFTDIQIVYDEMKEEYRESDIVIAGYSLGTGLAAYLSAKNNPRFLILNAPYYSIMRMIREKYPFMPEFLINFKIKTYKYIQRCKCPINIFHSEDDEMISLQHSLDLAKFFKKKDQLFILEDAGHAGINQNKEYQEILSRILI